MTCIESQSIVTEDEQTIMILCLCLLRLIFVSFKHMLCTEMVIKRGTRQRCQFGHFVVQYYSCCVIFKYNTTRSKQCLLSPHIIYLTVTTPPRKDIYTSPLLLKHAFFFGGGGGILRVKQFKINSAACLLRTRATERKHVIVHDIGLQY